MPRDNLGVVTLVVGNPVVNGTAISADVHNATVADLAAMIEDSLSRSGKGGMDSPMQFADGTAANPAITFSSETTTGFFRSAGLLGLAVVGAVRASLTNVLARFYTPVQMDSTLAVTGATALTGAVTASSTLAVTGTSVFTGRITATAGVAGLAVGDIPANPFENSPADSDLFSTASDVYVAVANMTTMIASTGRPTIVTLVPAAGKMGRISLAVPAAGGSCYFRLDRDGVPVGEINNTVTTGGGATIPIGQPTFCDIPGVAGIYTYVLYAKTAATADTIYVDYMSLISYEV